MVASNESRRLLTSEEAAEFLRVSPRTLWAMSNRGDIPVIRIGRLIRYSMCDLLDFVGHQRGAPTLRNQAISDLTTEAQQRGLNLRTGSQMRRQYGGR